MKKNALKILGLVTVVGLFTACKKDDVVVTPTPVIPTPVVAKTTSNFVADPAINNGHFAFYSLETNQQIPLADSATTKWDIAFRSTTIMTNSGTSGPGAGGAFVQAGTTFDSYTELSADSAFSTDNSAATPPYYAVPTGSGNGWYSYNQATNIITPIPGRIIAIRTASGKYAKLEITSYYKDAPVTPDASTNEARYYNFRFAYQPDGTKKF